MVVQPQNIESSLRPPNHSSGISRPLSIRTARRDAITNEETRSAGDGATVVVGRRRGGDVEEGDGGLECVEEEGVLAG
jgi:hypothetical protein